MIVYDKGQYEQLIYEMWERNFHDPIPYARFYFEHVYPKNQVILWQDQEKMKGMIHWNPYSQNFFGKTVPATYIVGVATNEEYRREGIMRKLLSETFMELRKKGESYTYLMPADENYYLPFDFRFGMSQMEREIYIEKDVAVLENWSFRQEPEEEKVLQQIADIENEVRTELFDLHTKITPDYLRQIGQEAKGDFARVVYVFEGEQYVGRCVIGTEDSFMTLSQIGCAFADKDKKSTFLRQLLAYGESRYHYGCYKIVTDMSWKGVLEDFAKRGEYRMPPAKEVPIIMFRILDFAKFASRIKGCEEADIQMYIADTKLPEQSGRYRWHISPKGSVVTKYENEDIIDAGKLEIADLTDLLFAGGEKKKTLEQMEGLTKEGREFFEKLIPVRGVCITEIV